MKSFLYVGDLHIRSTTPSRRKDPDMLATIFGKLEWIRGRATELESSAVVFGGDIGHFWDWKISLANKVAKLFESFPCPVLTIIGNHDVPGKNIGQLADTGLGDLVERHVIQLLSPTRHHRVGCFDIWGYHADTQQTEDMLRGALPTTFNREQINVAVVHAPIGPEDTIYCQGYQTLFLPSWAAVLFADIHHPFGPEETLAGSVLANAGTLFRQKIDEIDVVPSILVVEEILEFPGWHIRKETVPHKPASEVFELPDVVDSDLGKNFSKALREMLATRDLTPAELITTIGNEFGYSQSVIDTVLGELK